MIWNLSQPKILASLVCTMYINSADITYRILMTLTNSGEASQIKQAIFGLFWLVFWGDQSAITVESRFNKDFGSDQNLS